MVTGDYLIIDGTSYYVPGYEKYMMIFLSVMAAYVVWRFMMRILLFRKSGTPWWKAVIPVYDIYTMFKLFWHPVYFWIDFICEVIGLVLVAFGSEYGMILGCLFTFVEMAYGIVMSVNIGAHYGCSVPFRLGLVFLPTVFRTILVFSEKYEYKEKAYLFTIDELDAWADGVFERVSARTRRGEKTE